MSDIEHGAMRETAPGLWEPAIPVEPTGWAGFQARRSCRKAGGHYWHIITPMAGIGCCQCGVRDDLRPKTPLCSIDSECRGADFSRVSAALAQGVIDHADRDGLTGVARAVFIDRGQHAVGEACSTAPTKDPHLYWCAFPDRECNCGVTGERP